MDAGRTVAALLRVCVLDELQYRVNFFVYLFQSMLSLATGLVVIWLVFDNVDELNGWTRPELLVVLGTYTILGGLLRSVIQPNMMQLMSDIQEGTFDFVLVKPMDAQLLASVRKVQVWQGVDVLVGAVVAVVGVSGLDTAIGAAQIAAFAVLLVAGVVVIYCFWLLATTLAFWVVRMEEIAYLFEGVWQAGRWPVGIYPGWMRAGLTFLVPIAFAVTVPGEALTGRLTTTTVAVTVAVIVLFVIVSRRVFRLGLRRYSGASA